MDNREEIEEKTENVTASKTQVKRDWHGRLLPGASLNPKGSTPQAVSLDKQAVLKAMQDAGTRHGKAFIDFVFDKAYSNNTVLCKVLDKLVADVSLGIKTADIIGNTIILQFTNYKPEAKEEAKEAIIAKDAIFESVENKGENGSRPSGGYNEEEE